MPTCGKCHQTGDDTSFYPNAIDGESWCKRCINNHRIRRVSVDLDRKDRVERTQKAITSLMGQFQSNREQFVYLVEALGKWKIGYSQDVDKRIKTFNTALPTPCRLLAVAPGGRELEKILHQRFDGSRLRGEWFNKSPEILKAFNHLPGSMVFLEGYVTATPPLDAPAT